MSRSLTFLDEPSSPSDDSTGFVVGYCILAVSSAVTLLQTVLETRRDLYGKHSLKFLLRWVAIALIVENSTLAALEHRQSIHATWKDIVYVIHATLAPSLLLSMFDVTYMIHKIRSIPFCGGIHVESRSNRKHSPAVALKLCLRLVAIVLLLLGILVNFGIFFDEDFTLAGRVGWVALIQDGDTLTGDEQLQLILSLLPMAVVTVCCLYFSLALWRYGTSFSMVVYSSFFNPWFTPFFGTIALGATQWFGERFFSIMSHAGIFVFLETILLLLIQINKDLESESELKSFLSAVGSTPYIKRREIHAGNTPSTLNAASAADESKILDGEEQGEEEKEEEKQEEMDEEMEV